MVKLDNQNIQRASRLKYVIIILAVLLALSVGALAARYIYLKWFSSDESAVSTSQNIIGDNTETKLPVSTPADLEENSEESGYADTSDKHDALPSASNDNSDNAKSDPQTDEKQATVLELYSGNSEVNEKFTAENMFPGDVIKKSFCVKTHHDDNVTLNFKIEVTEEIRSLGDVLHIKVINSDSKSVLCDAPFSQVKDRDFSELLVQNGAKETISNYDVEVSLATSVGNEYTQASLKADFKWYVAGEDKESLAPAPNTGDSFYIILWIVAALCSLALIILLLVKRRKGER